MKKVLLSLINTDIKNKLFKYYRYIVCIVVFIVFNNCDNPQAPTWQTEINLPLLSSEFLFSEVINDSTIVDDEGLITVIYEQESMFPDGFLPLEGFEDLFTTPPIPDLGSYESPDYLIEIIPVEIPLHSTSFEDYFLGAENDFCIPEETIIESFPGTTITVPVPIDFGEEVQATIDELFLEWNYATINTATLNLNENINLFFPTSFTYQVTGFENDIIFNDGVFVDNEPRLSDALSFVLTLSYDEENLEGLIPCNEEDFYGNPYTGWAYNSEQTSIFIGGTGSNFGIESVQSVNGRIREQTITLLDTIPIPPEIPFNILGGFVSDDNTNESGAINSIEFSITNNSSFPEIIDFSLKLPNFIMKDNLDQYTQTFEINKQVTNDNIADPVGDEGDFSGSKFSYYYDVGCNLLDEESCPDNPDCEWNDNNTVCLEIESDDNIDFLYMNIEINVPSETGDIDINNMFDFSVDSISMNPIEFDAITTDFTHDFSITIPEFIVPAAPEGSNIEGLQIVDPIIHLNLGNPFDIDNTLTLTLTSIIDVESTSLNIEADLGYGENQITIQGETCVNEIYNDFDMLIGTESCSTYDSGGEPYPISSFLQAAPELIAFSGSAVLGGIGTIGPDPITGGFGLELPFSFIIGTEIDDTFLDVNLVPETSTLLTPVDEDTYESINNSLEEAALISNITNNSPLVGVTSMLVSTNNSFFPSYLDEIIDIDSEQFNCSDTACVFTNGEIFDRSISMLGENFISGTITDYVTDNNEIYALTPFNIADIDTIEFTPLSSTDLRVKILKFITDDDYLLIARLAMLELPCPTINEYGYVIDEGYDASYHSSIDHDQIGLINFIDGEKPRYLNTMMTLVNSHYPDCPNPNANDDGVIHLISTHSISIDSYANFKVNFGEY